MQLAVVSIGSSKGIYIPQTILDSYQITDSVEVEMHGDGLLLRFKPVRRPREGWEEQFRQMHQNGDDKMTDPDVLADEL